MLVADMSREMERFNNETVDEVREVWIFIWRSVAKLADYVKEENFIPEGARYR